MATALADGSGPPWGVAVYLTAVAVLGLVCFVLLPETNPTLVRARTGLGSKSGPDAGTGAAEAAAPA